ncbi:MAG: hypothetical protein FWG45_05405, partial [Oscillospiraceae bacterium]|nr:hypothetical protein [Oscillospiraceae bacterium]
AGAVTAVFMAGTTSVPPSRIPVVLDRPFVFAIVDNTTNLPIFLGSLLDLDESDSSERTPTPKEKKPEPTPEPIPEPLPYVCACRNCENCGFLGGAYGFGRVTNKSAKPQIEDALAILRYLVKLSSPIDNNVNARAAACITNPGSNEPKMADALAILRKIVKLSSELEK